MNFLGLPAVNGQNVRNVYPSAVGQTVAAAGSSVSQMTSASTSGRPVAAAADSAANPANDPVTFASAVGQSGNIVVAGLVLLVLVFGIMMLSEKFGGENTSIKATFFNVMIIGLAAAVGTPIWKYLAVRYPIPGASSWILAG